MPLKAPKQSERPLVSEGTHPARCVQVIDLGTHVSPFLDDDGNPKSAHKLKFTFELPSELHEFDKEKGKQPAWVSLWATLSFHKRSNLGKILKTWVGAKAMEAEDFDLLALVGQPCLVQISHTAKEDKTYENVVGITSVPKGMKVKKLVNDTLAYSIDDHGFTGEGWDALPDWVKNKLMESDEYNQD